MQSPLFRGDKLLDFKYGHKRFRGPTLWRLSPTECGECAQGWTATTTNGGADLMLYWLSGIIAR